MVTALDSGANGSGSSPGPYELPNNGQIVTVGSRDF